MLRTFSTALVIATALACMRGEAAAQPADETAILGRWVTPGGNSVLIARSSGGTLEGRLVEIAEAQQAFGFKEQDLALKGFAITGTAVAFDVAVRIDEADRKDCEVKYQRFSGTLAAGNMTGTLPKAHFEGCALIAEDGTDAMTYTRSPPLECLALPDNKPIFRIARHGPQAVTAEASIGSPLAEQAPTVAVDTVAPMLGAPTAVSGAEVEWQLKRGDSVYVTYYTDSGDDGIAQLQFVLLPDGGFAPAFQMRQKPGTVPAGKYSVVARIPSLATPDPVLRPGQVAPDPAPPATFDLELKRNGVLLNFLDETGSTPVSLLSWPEPMPGRSPWAKPAFRLELADFNATDDAPEKTVTLTSYDGNAVVETRDFALKRKGLGIYRFDGRAITAAFPPLGGVKIPHPLAQEIYVAHQPVTRIEASYAGAVVNTLKLYDDVHTIHRERIKQILDRYQQTIDGIRASAHVKGPEQLAALAYKQSLIDRARQAVDNPKLALESSAPILAAEAFMSQLSSKGPFPPADAAVSRFVWQSRGAGSESIQNPDMSLMMDILDVRTAQERAALANAERQYWSNVEQNYVETAAALQHALGLDIELPPDTDPAARQAAIEALLGNAVITIGKGLASIAFAKELGLIYGAFVLATGTTLDGEDAGIVDYLSAGLDVASFDVHTGPSEWIAKGISRKVRRLEEIRSVAAGVALAAGRANAVFEDLRYASQVVRMKNGLMSEIWTIAKNANLTIEEQVRQVSTLMTRIPNPEVAKLMSAEFATIPGVLNRDIGLLLHRQKNLETRAFLDLMATAGKVTVVGAGRYQWKAVVNGVEATYDEFSEFKVGGSRIDGALAKVSKTESFTLIRDMTTRLTDEHWAKGEGYKTLMETLVPGLKGVPASYCEYYWTATSPAALKSQLDQY